MPIRIPHAPRLLLAAAVAAMAALAGAAPAHADLKLCNRMSYVAEGAIGIQQGDAVATRGWFRVDPGQCRGVVQGDLQYDHLYVDARALPVYGDSPLPENGDTQLCVAAGNFVIAGARSCRAGQRLAHFTEVKPSAADGLAIYLSEEAGYTDEQARDAGIQRLLNIAGYDAGPVDGVRGDQTDAVLMLFLHDNKLPPTSAARSDFFDVLLAAAQKTGAGFAWCNDTPDVVMAAIGIEDKGAVTSRGWYRVDPGKCLRPDIEGTPQRLFSYGEAVDPNGQPVRQGDTPLRWGGGTTLCTREVKFELTDHHDCAGNGLVPTGFAPVDPAAGATVHFKLP